MQYSTILLSALLTTSTTLAAPTWNQPQPDTSLTVTLGPHGPATVLQSGSHAHRRPSHHGPFSTVELAVGAAVTNQAYRCKILDHMHNPIVIVRGANTDITFGDGDKGAWTFRDGAAKVSKIVCDLTFQKGSPDAAKIRVSLSNQATETGSQTVFDEGKREQSPPVGSMGPYQTVELIVGELVKKQDYRCQVVDKENKPIIVLRGANRDITFSDADKGEWTFEKESEVSNIICDPTFVAMKV